MRVGLKAGGMVDYLVDEKAALMVVYLVVVLDVR